MGIKGMDKLVFFDKVLGDHLKNFSPFTLNRIYFL